MSATAQRHKTADERFDEKCGEPHLCGCVRWLGTHNNAGYGLFWDGTRKVLAHRWAWERANGPIAPGLVVDHVRKRGCQFTDCVNVAHLEPVTHAVNVQRGDSAGALRRLAATITHCRQGHPFDQENTGHRKNGWRICLACRAETRRTRPKPRGGTCGGCGDPCYRAGGRCQACYRSRKAAA